jgi:hypothetical protein
MVMGQSAWTEPSPTVSCAGLKSLKVSPILRPQDGLANTGPKVVAQLLSRAHGKVDFKLGYPWALDTFASNNFWTVALLIMT